MGENAQEKAGQRAAANRRKDKRGVWGSAARRPAIRR